MSTPLPDGRFRRFLFATKTRIALVIVSCLLAVVVLATLLVCLHFANGGMIARQEPSRTEAYIAGRLLNLSIPDAAKTMVNPLNTSPDGADLAAGRFSYQQHCAVCHGADGGGKTEAGGGLYPRPVDLRGPETTSRTDGTLFYLIRNGIRNTGMPGWQLTDSQTWQLVAWIRNLPKTSAKSPSTTAANHAEPAHYVGSSNCRSCHQAVYDRWKTTLMANVVRDPREHPDAITPDLAVHDPLVTFTKDDIAFVYGSRWKQRYFKKVGDDYFPLPAQWDVTHKKWRPYFVKDDWWTAHYPPDNLQRPTGTTCDGCHSVNYDIATKQVTEWNVGCEKCHGPGGEHIKNPVSATIVNPARLDFVQGNDTCIQCHSQGRPPANPINGKYYDWPVGYHVGLKLGDFWKLEEHKLGETTFTHFPDGTAHKNRMQGNDFVQSQMYTHGVACFTCHDAHGSDNPALLRKPANTLCLDCHSANSPNGPRAASIEEHTHHQAGSTGSECVSCHMPKIAQTIGDVNVRSHTFRFVSPVLTETLKIPNACNACHTDKSNSWTIDTLRTWANQSLWRTSQ